jgi:N utilization substance protein A
MEVIVPDDQLSLAIGRRGQNVRLASKLTNWRIDVKNETRYGRQKQAGYQSLLHIRGLTEELADRLYEAGIVSPEVFVEASTEELEELTGLSPATLTSMQEEAQRLGGLAASIADETPDSPLEAPPGGEFVAEGQSTGETPARTDEEQPVGE